MDRNTQLLRTAEWLISIGIDHIEGAAQTGVATQKKAGKTNEQCAKYLVTNHRAYIDEVLAFNESLGVFFLE